MSTKLIMTLSAGIFGIAGFTLTFTPERLIHYLQVETSNPQLLIMQLLGAFYFAFAMLNWMNKASLMGGIYNRAVAMANFTHFMVAGLALIKAAISSPELPIAFLVAALIYAFFGVAFGIILFRHPIKEATAVS